MDVQGHRHVDSAFEIDPFARRDGQFTVPCPVCGEQYVSEKGRFLGFVFRKTFFPLLFLLLPTLVVSVLVVFRLFICVA